MNGSRSDAHLFWEIAIWCLLRPMAGTLLRFTTDKLYLIVNCIRDFFSTYVHVCVLEFRLNGAEFTMISFALQKRTVYGEETYVFYFRVSIDYNKKCEIEKLVSQSRLKCREGKIEYNNYVFEMINLLNFKGRFGKYKWLWYTMSDVRKWYEKSRWRSTHEIKTIANGTII